MFGDPVENPKDFDKCPLMSLAKKITDGVHKKPVYTKTGKPFISVTNINRGVIDFTDCKFVSEEAYQTMIKTTYPERGDVLYTKVGATYGIPAYVDTDEQFGLYVSVCLIKPKHDLIDARFLTESMRMEYIKKQADDRIKGIGVPDLHLQEIKSFEVLCPPRELQEQFVAFVQQSDKSKFSCLKSQFIEMFGDPESVIDNAINTVADVADVQVGLVIKPTRFYSADGTGTPAFRSLNIGEMYIRDSEWIYFTDKGMVENQRTIAHTGDVLVVRSGYPGTSCVVTPEYDGRNVVDLIIAHPNVSKILPEFLCAFTNYPHGKIQIENSQRGVAQKHFNVSLYNKMKIVVPPMELQKQFVQLFHQSDKSKLCFHLHTTTLHYAHS